MSEPARLNLTCDEVKCIKINAIIHPVEEGGGLGRPEFTWLFTQVLVLLFMHPHFGTFSPF